jgi:hypothetical protein
MLTVKESSIFGTPFMTAAVLADVLARQSASTRFEQISERPKHSPFLQKVVSPRPRRREGEEALFQMGRFEIPRKVH